MRLGILALLLLTSVSDAEPQFHRSLWFTSSDVFTTTLRMANERDLWAKRDAPLALTIRLEDQEKFLDLLRKAVFELDPNCGEGPTCASTTIIQCRQRQEVWVFWHEYRDQWPKNLWEICERPFAI